ncbi:MAG TPA: hypothetical protein PKI14_04390 [Fervidobacterium sp.]|nr:hypothetical protein [Fervidobacterium sp.]
MEVGKTKVYIKGVYVGILEKYEVINNVGHYWSHTFDRECTYNKSVDTFFTVKGITLNVLDYTLFVPDSGSDTGIFINRALIE